MRDEFRFLAQNKHHSFASGAPLRETKIISLAMPTPLVSKATTTTTVMVTVKQF
jgi:hypothetical protein